MSTKFLKDTIRKIIEPLESSILSDKYFGLQKSLGYSDRLNLVCKYAQNKFNSQSSEAYPEITFLLYSKACERLLIPLVFNLLQRPEVQDGKIHVNVIVLFGIHRLKLMDSNLEELQKMRCQIQTDYFSLIRACYQPNQKLVVLCLDHRKVYRYHFWGVDTVDTLKSHGVSTLSIQHGGTRADSVEELASAASDMVLVWGKRVYREIVERYNGDPRRFHIVGNPLHDRLANIDNVQVQSQFKDHYPEVSSQLGQKHVVLLATCLHTEYRGMENEVQMYRDYIRHIYSSIDFSRTLLLVKMHPLDTLAPNLYIQAIPDENSKKSIIVIEPTVSNLDIYSLLSISELLITRASTVAEEAMLMGKNVISFDLLPDGPSKNYRHLEEYGSYTTVYANPENELKKAINYSLSEAVSEQNKNTSLIEEELTCSLDGHSTDRAVNEILTYFWHKNYQNYYENGCTC
ncbi:hypothetical protein XM38_013770 [Halomicronema hongdechloris C2206]|uniref:UDP-N-acetylglucosamine 2-epimerase domain-containing protein n=1 Tax=Halomicronema hongdechloris C2206 TaxID=1641165 RepID=A0A1Z3HJG2_9CYAN|nr:CDP-glycerol glycerophosphotransferase family protein [Halomicronema hongdechloris]ASC70438.1 hypothetical protein XM38_013770 [Halomicronema hongdechloris C2206]